MWWWFFAAFVLRSYYRKRAVAPNQRRAYMNLKIYGNYLAPDAPLSLQVDIERLEKLYSLADINGHSEVTPLLIPRPVVKE